MTIRYFAAVVLLASACLPAEVLAQTKTWSVEPAPRDLVKSFSQRTGAIDVKQALAEPAVVQHIQAIQLSVKGKNFPRLSRANAKVVAANAVAECCVPYQTRNVSEVAGIDLEGPMHVKKSVAHPEDGPRLLAYSPPAGGCWTIQSYTRSVSTAGGTYDASHTAMPANFSFNTSSQYSATLQDTKNYVLTLKLKDKDIAIINAKLEEYTANYGSYAYAIQSSHGTVTHQARVYGTGTINPKTGHSWYHGYINTTEICCPAEVRDPNQLKTTLRAWVDEYVRTIPADPGPGPGPGPVRNLRNAPTN